MDLHALLGFTLIALTLSLTPGADWAYTISAGLRQRSAAPAVAGLCTGYLVHTALVAAGLGMLLAARPALVSWLSAAGAVYLLWLGLTTARSWRTAGLNADQATASGAAGLRDFLRGAGTSGINPKGLLLYVAVMPQFVTTSGEVPVALQTSLMGLSHVAISVLVYSLVALGARRLLASRPRSAQLVTLASGAIMLGIGGLLLTEQAVTLLGSAA